MGDRLRAIGYARGVSASAGENIALGGHREDILRASFTEIGIGIATGAPDLPDVKQPDSATYTTDFGGVADPSLPSG